MFHFLVPSPASCQLGYFSSVSLLLCQWKNRPLSFREMMHRDPSLGCDSVLSVCYLKQKAFWFFCWITFVGFFLLDYLCHLLEWKGLWSYSHLTQKHQDKKLLRWNVTLVSLKLLKSVCNLMFFFLWLDLGSSTLLMCGGWILFLGIVGSKDTRSTMMKG